jgi:hypothetical protein
VLAVRLYTLERSQDHLHPQGGRRMFCTPGRSGERVLFSITFRGFSGNYSARVLFSITVGDVGVRVSNTL